MTHLGGKGLSRGDWAPGMGAPAAGALLHLPRGGAHQGRAPGDRDSRWRDRRKQGDLTQNAIFLWILRFSFR